MRLAGIIVFLCITHYEGTLSVHKKTHRTGARAREKPGRCWGRGIRGAPGLTTNQIVVPRRAGAYVPGGYFWGEFPSIHIPRLG
jgi:hypothetical protein